MDEWWREDAQIYLDALKREGDSLRERETDRGGGGGKGIFGSNALPVEGPTTVAHFRDVFQH